MTNLEKSERVIASILRALLERGLQDEWELSFEQLELGEEFEPFFAGAAKWLVAEGIVRATDVSELIGGDLVLYSPSLTSRGFAIVGHKFQLDGRAITAAEVIDAKSKGSQTYTGIGDFLGGFLGGYTKSMGS